MVNQEKYASADPVTQKMIDTWMRSLKKRYPDNSKMPIKKSSSAKSNHPGLQSGARGLLNYYIGGVMHFNFQFFR